MAVTLPAKSMPPLVVVSVMSLANRPAHAKAAAIGQGEVEGPGVEAAEGGDRVGRRAQRDCAARIAGQRRRRNRAAALTDRSRREQCDRVNRGNAAGQVDAAALGGQRDVLADTGPLTPRLLPLTNAKSNVPVLKLPSVAIALAVAPSVTAPAAVPVSVAAEIVPLLSLIEPAETSATVFVAVTLPGEVEAATFGGQRDVLRRIPGRSRPGCCR